MKKLDFFQTAKTAHIIAGMYLPAKSDSIIKRSLLIGYDCVILGVSFTFFICEILALGETLNDIKKIISHIGMLITHIAAIGKLYNIMWKQKRISKIYDLLQLPEFDYEDFKDFKPAKRFRKEKWRSQILITALICTYTGVGLNTFISVASILYDEEYEDNAKFCKDIMPYFFVIPFSYNTKLKCYYATFFASISLIFFAWVIAAHDGTFVAILNCLKTKLLILSDAFSTIRERCLEKLNLPQDYEVLHDDENPLLEKALYNEIRHCTLNLMTLLNVYEEVEDIFNFITLVQAVASLLIFASCLFVATTVPISSPLFFAQIHFFGAVLLQLSTYCWYGNEITLASESIQQGIYDANWLSSNRRFKNCMLMNMTRVQKPVRVSIGKFTPLSLVTLVTVCRGSFSYFAVFRTVK